MSKENRLEIAPIWPIIWAVIYLAILILGVIAPTGDLITTIKLGGICLCLLYVILASPHDYLLILAMLTTSVSDIILALNNTSTAGIITFFAVQIFHLLRLGWANARAIIIYLITAIALLFLNYFLGIFPMLYAVCAFYATTLILNLYSAWSWFYASPKNLHAASALLGFTLFLCCDLCVGISYLALIEVLPVFCYGLANFFAWFFYYPSQILVSNSSKCAIIEDKGR